jgi:hypothetical protein
VQRGVGQVTSGQSTRWFYPGYAPEVAQPHRGGRAGRHNQAESIRSPRGSGSLSNPSLAGAVLRINIL